VGNAITPGKFLVRKTWTTWFKLFRSFFPTKSEDADRNGNPRPGTVVDKGVTAIYDFDFFLQAHGGLQGTTRPTHYYVVVNEMGFKADELQSLTNNVSYMFARATKARTMTVALCNRLIPLL
jgi:hypothetical protein